VTSDDQLVIDEILGGAANRFEVLMRRYNALVFRTARGVLRSDGDAEECAQRSWIRAYERLHQYDGTGAFPAWVGRIAFREAIHMLRAAKRDRLVPLPSGSGVSLFDEGDALVPPQEVGMQLAQVREGLEQAIDRLPWILREVFVLSEVQELSAEEVASIVGISEGNVRVRLHRARQVMKSTVTANKQAFATAFSFDGARCDRVVCSVLEIVLRMNAAPKSESRSR